jgi:hypothetical protein
MHKREGRTMQNPMALTGRTIIVTGALVSHRAHHQRR